MFFEVKKRMGMSNDYNYLKPLIPREYDESDYENFEKKWNEIECAEFEEKFENILAKSEIIASWEVCNSYDVYDEENYKLMILKLKEGISINSSCSGYIIVKKEKYAAPIYYDLAWVRLNKKHNKLMLNDYISIVGIKCGTDAAIAAIEKYSEIAYNVMLDRERKFWAAKEELGGTLERNIVRVINKGIYDCWVNNNYLYMLKLDFPNFDVNINKYKLEDIVHYRILGDKRSVAKVKGDIGGGGSDLFGAVVGGVIAGPAGAIIGSREEVSGNIRTTVEQVDDRYVELKTKTETIECHLKDTIDTLERLIPEKDYDRNPKKVVKVEKEKTVKQEKGEVKETKSNAFEELRELKKLLDEDIITKEEFEAKKKELLARA